MPFVLNAITDTSAYEQYKSVLIVPCRFCPAASAAMKNGKPYFELFRRFLTTGAYEEFITSLESKLQSKGIRTDIFRSRWVHQFVMCMWTRRRRAALRNRAQNYDALIVLGCEAAVQTVRDAIAPCSAAVVQGVVTEGIMSITPHLSFPANLSLRLDSISRYEYLGTD